MDESKDALIEDDKDAAINFSFIEENSHSLSTRIPYSTKNKAVIIFNHKKKKYILSRDFYKQTNEQEDINKRDRVNDFICKLNSRKELLPNNNKSYCCVWILAFILCFFLIGTCIWIALLLLVIMLFNPIIVIFIAWALIFCVTRLPIIVIDFLLQQLIRPLKRFIKEQDNLCKNNARYTCSSDGSYIEMSFINVMFKEIQESDNIWVITSDDSLII